MNINRVIRDLYKEKKRLDRIIARLEEMQRHAATQVVAAREKKRGRKSMNEQARLEVSERMKRYWDTRRKQVLAAEQARSEDQFRGDIMN